MGTRKRLSISTAQFDWSMARSSVVPLVAKDGYKLVGTLYSPATSSRPRARMVVAGATAVPQSFYKRFAEYAVAEGYEVLTLDYRGVGLSAPEKLKGFRMSFLDWGQLDLPVAIDKMHDPQQDLFLVGHSYGAQALGMLPNHSKVKALYAFGLGAGWHGWMPRTEQLKVGMMWNVVGPFLVWYYGHLAWNRLGMGENLPADIFYQWRRWCKHPHYFFEDPELPHLRTAFAQVRTPITAANATDDLWAPPKSRDAFLTGYANAAITRVDINPRDVGLAGVGHMGYFRQSSSALWRLPIDCFAKLGGPSATASAAAGTKGSE